MRTADRSGAGRCFAIHQVRVACCVREADQAEDVVGGASRGRGQRRTARRHRTALARLAVADELPDFADDVSGRLDDVARIEALHRALADLPGPELEVLALCVWSGVSYAEAAEALHVPVGTIRSRLFRARAKLARLTDGELRRPHRSAANQNSREPTTMPDQLMSRPAIAGLSNRSDISGKSGTEARR